MSEENKGKSMEQQVVVFALANEEFGVDINKVREIIRIEEITKIPNTESYIKGVINLRGKIIVVIDLAMKLSLPVKETDKNTRILVVEVGDNTIGMIVDLATEVLHLSSDLVKPPPSIITEKINADYIIGVGILGERLLILLDLAKVLGNKEIEHIEEIMDESETKSNVSTQKEDVVLADNTSSNETSKKLSTKEV